MRALIFKSVGAPLAVEKLPDPEPREGEVVIRVSRCGVCGTDLHATSGHGMTLPLNSHSDYRCGSKTSCIIPTRSSPGAWT